MALVAGKKRVPKPATGKTALRTGLCWRVCVVDFVDVISNHPFMVERVAQKSVG
tara:strand:- start:51904 stop:52065 length:162 start_codon:yes stop_codon:yes gene_type:complete